MAATTTFILVFVSHFSILFALLCSLLLRRQAAPEITRDFVGSPVTLV